MPDESHHHIRPRYFEERDGLDHRTVPLLSRLLCRQEHPPQYDYERSDEVTHLSVGSVIHNRTQSKTAVCAAYDPYADRLALNTHWSDIEHGYDVSALASALPSTIDVFEFPTGHGDERIRFRDASIEETLREEFPNLFPRAAESPIAPYRRQLSIGDVTTD